MKIVHASRFVDKLENDKMTVCLGMFDGLHRGHFFLLSQLRQHAEKTQTKSMVITFATHPARLLRKKETDFLLASPKEREERLRRSGFVDFLYVLPFDADVAMLSPEEFLFKWVFPAVEVYQFLAGHDFRFGAKRSGTLDTLYHIATQKNFGVIPVVEHTPKEGSVNSTRIRQMLKLRKVEEANRMLGYEYMLRGTVIHGQRKGTEIGFPTANIKLEDDIKLLPGRGVYATQVEISSARYANKRFWGMMNIGVRPTVSTEEEEIAEVHLLDFSDDIYDTEITVFIKRFIREEKKFASIGELLVQLHQDKKWVDSYVQELS